MVNTRLGQPFIGLSESIITVLIKISFVKHPAQ